MWASLAVMAGVVLLFLLVIEIPTFVRMHRESQVRECADRLRQVGVYFKTYESRYHAYPTPGASTWFGELWTSGVATDGEVFRCPFVQARGPATHFRGLRAPGSMVFGATYSWTATGITNGAPLDLPMAGDDDQAGVPNHGRETERNFLCLSGRVEAFAIGTPTEQVLLGLLEPTNRGWAAPAGTK